jgi:hydrogenase nickel incorporation protein HypA/HybF
MHELALAESIVKAVEEELKKHHSAKLIRVSVQVGGLHEIVPDSLEFGFNALIIDTPLAGAELAVEKIPLKGQCKQCGY